ncbi:MAG: GspH/FimT family pseudopilin [Burkholderiaceae bacterium]
MLSRAHRRGFSIIELMVAVAIVGVMLALGIPSMATYLQNSKIGSAAKSYQAGIQLARSEAIRQNLPIEFVLTNAPIVAGIEGTTALNQNGVNWVVRAPVLPASGATVYTLVEAKAALEGSGQAAGATPAVEVAGSGGFTGAIVFTGLGGTSDGAATAFDLSNPTGGACAPAGPMRCLRVRVSAGGQVQICDPQAAAGDSRACP